MRGVGLEFFEAVVEFGADGLLVELLTDEDELLHAVSILGIPVVLYLWFADEEVGEFFLGHRSIPETGIAQRELLACLLEDVAGVELIAEVADALCTNDVLRPATSNEVVEE